MRSVTVTCDLGTPSLPLRGEAEVLPAGGNSTRDIGCPTFSLVWRLTAEDVQGLREVSGAIHDAHFDPDDLRFVSSDATLVVPLLQEGWPSGPTPSRELVSESWRVREYRVALFHGELRVRHVLSMPQRGDWGEQGMLDALAVDSAKREVRLEAGGFLHVPVSRLEIEVEISDSVSGYVRRRVGKFTGIATDTPWPD